MTIFLPNPMPERFVQVVFGEAQPKRPLLRLSAGLVRTTEDHCGLKIVPTTEVAISVDPADGDVETVFGLPASSARTLAKRLLEMCDAADSANGGG